MRFTELLCKQFCNDYLPEYAVFVRKKHLKLHSSVYLLKSITMNLNKMNIDYFTIKKNTSELKNTTKYKSIIG